VSWTQVRYDVADGVGTLTLQRPERLNAVTADMARELGEVCAAVDADDAVRCWW
jgi:enoyl-CoA hydratase/carnithine racemase